MRFRGGLKNRTSGNAQLMAPLVRGHVVAQGGEGWASKVDWGGASNAFLNILGGVGEMVVGGAGTYFSAGTASPVCVPLIVDGGYRIIANLPRLAGYLTLNTQFANSMPSNIGATIGKLGDMAFGVPANQYGFGQAIGGAANDLTSFVVTGGTAASLNNLVSNYSTANAIWYFNAYAGYTNSMFFNCYSLKK